VYPSQRVKFSTGFENGTWSFESEEYDMANSEQSQIFFLLPNVVIGSVIRIDFLGKVSIQPGDNRYYTVMSKVEVYGAPLSALPSSILTKSIVCQASDIPDEVNDLLD
jgi:hypothetical protein